MLRRHAAVLLLALVLAGIGTCDAVAAIPSLTSTPPTQLGGPPPGLSHSAPKPRHSPPKPRHSPPKPRHVTGSLPMTGADLPLELAIAGGFVLLGALLHAIGRSRRYRYRRFSSL